MRIPTLMATALVAAATTGCGLIRSALEDSMRGNGGIPSRFGAGSLAVTNDAANGDHALVSVLFLDVLTGAVDRQEDVDVLPGEDFDIMDVPAGPYEVVGVFDDDAEDRPGDEPGYPVTIDPVVEAHITFFHPSAPDAGG